MLRFPWFLAIFAAYLLAAIFLVPPLPHIHTRYITVAWEMWQRHDFLLPVLNGHPYPDKPPLFFWLVHLGWAVFGVNEIWPRLIAPLFFLSTMVLLPRLADLLWPGRPPVRWVAPILLMGTSIFQVYAVFPMMEGLLTLFVLLVWIGAAMAWRGQMARGWLLAGVALGLGVLAKGPVVLLYTLPIILLGPLWLTGEIRPHWGKWYGGALLAVVLGVAIGLAWAIPAADAGGQHYADDIFVNQTTQRFSGALGHPEPWWWFLAMLPWATFPWIFWPALWRAGRQPRLLDAGFKFCLIGLAVPFVTFSAVSSKHVHYLVPMMPLFALAAGRMLAGAAPLRSEPRLALPLVVALLAALVALLASLASHSQAPAWAQIQAFVHTQPVYLQHLSLALGLLAALSVMLALLMPKDGLGFSVQRIALMSLGLTLALAVEVKISFYRYLDVVPMAREIAQYEREGRPVAINETYYGQFHFSGRMTRPFAVITDRSAQLAWATAHPNGVFMSFIRGDTANLPAKPLYITPYKNKVLAAWSAQSVVASQGRVLNETFDRPTAN